MGLLLPRAGQVTDFWQILLRKVQMDVSSYKSLDRHPLHKKDHLDTAQKGNHHGIGSNNLTLLTQSENLRGWLFLLRSYVPSLIIT